MTENDRNYHSFLLSLGAEWEGEIEQAFEPIRYSDGFLNYEDAASRNQLQ